MMESYAVVSICQRPDEFPPLQQIVLPAGVNALLHEILQADIPLPDAPDDMSDWVVPSGDGWAPCPLPDYDNGSWLPDRQLHAPSAAITPCRDADELRRSSHDQMLAVAHILRLCADAIEQGLAV